MPAVKRRVPQLSAPAPALNPEAGDAWLRTLTSETGPSACGMNAGKLLQQQKQLEASGLQFPPL